MTVLNAHHEPILVRKETKWLTNSPVLASILEGVCPNQDPTKTEQDWHRHITLIGGTLCRQAQVYPVKLVKAVLRGIRQQLQQDGVYNEVNAYSAGPVPTEEPPEPIYDSTTGYMLDPKLVAEARIEEVTWMTKNKIWKYVPLQMAWKRLGRRPLTMRWVDVNKGDSTHPRYRSRLVVTQFGYGS